MKLVYTRNNLRVFQYQIMKQIKFQNEDNSFKSKGIFSLLIEVKDQIKSFGNLIFIAVLILIFSLLTLGNTQFFNSLIHLFVYSLLYLN